MRSYSPHCTLGSVLQWFMIYDLLDFALEVTVLKSMRLLRAQKVKHIYKILGDWADEEIFCIKGQYKQMSSLTREVSSIWRRIISLTLAVKLWLLALLMRNIAGVVLKELKSLRSSWFPIDWMYLSAALSLQVTYMHSLCFHVHPDIVEGTHNAGEAELLIARNYSLGLVHQKGQVSTNPQDLES